MAGRKHRFYENRMLKKWFNTNRRLQETQSMGGCDGHNEWLAIELAQHPIPQWIKDELGQAQRDNKNFGGKELLPIAVIREKYQKDKDAIVMMTLEDFNRWFGK